MTQPDAATVFDPLRPRLVRVAYRMLGSVADAEDVVQDAFIRWMSTNRDVVLEPEGFLRRIVTRLCLDQLKSARRRRETYLGPWLPEPVVEDTDEEVEDVTLPLMMALERLSPLERAAFLLHDVFGVGFEEIAETLDRSPAACRQLASRARTRVRAERPRFDVPEHHGLELARAFFDASRSGDVAELRAMLSADVSIHSDGGGIKPAALEPLIGLETVTNVFTTLAEKVFSASMSQLVRYCYVNGLPGFITIEKDNTLQTTALDIVDGRIAGIYMVRNPEKLRHLDA
jgi:RNA polymerase sigma-70 factor (ECF subfamily)